MEQFSNRAFLKFNISQMEQFSNSTFLKWSISQMKHFSNRTFLKWSNSQMEHFGLATLCHISRSQEQRNMACDVLLKASKSNQFILDLLKPIDLLHRFMKLLQFLSGNSQPVPKVVCSSQILRMMKMKFVKGCQLSSSSHLS